MGTDRMVSQFAGLSCNQRILKRAMDIVISGLGLLLLGWLILLGAAAATLSTRRIGFFRQVRVGRYGRRFKVVKLRTMKSLPGLDSTVTTAHDCRITRVGKLLRRTKIDELPQLWNVLIGQMSMVGPRPDVPGFADKLTGKDRAILSLKPGMTGPATLCFRDEERLLAKVPDPERHNREVLFPAKVEINLEYLANYTLRADIKYLLWTLVPRLRRADGFL